MFCLLTLKTARSISSVTDSTIPQSDIDSIHGQCAADFMKLNTDETKFGLDYVFSVYLSFRSCDSCRRLPEPKHHSFLFNH